MNDKEIMDLTIRRIINDNKEYRKKAFWEKIRYFFRLEGAKR